MQASLRSLRGEFINPLARMLPLSREQTQVYSLATIPPGYEGYQPRWEVIGAVLGARQQLETRIDLIPDFHLLALVGSATTNTVGGFRAQLYDLLKKLRMADRMVQFPNLAGELAGGAVNGAFFLREPYRFDLPRSQIVVQLQNLEAVVNTIQLALYGVGAPFEGTIRDGQ